MDKKWQNLPGQFMDRSTGRCGRCGGRARPVWGGCSWCWRLVGRVSGAYPPTCVLRCPPPLLAAALRALLVVAGSAAATVATAWSRPSQRTRAALLILPRAADRRCSGRAWWRQTARARWISRATCSCAGAPRRHLIAWLRLLSIDLQLDGAMSSPGPAAKLALKRQTGLMGGDMGLAATTAAAQAQRSASASWWGVGLVRLPPPVQ